MNLWVTVAANVDDKFYGSFTAAIVREDGSDIIELEEAYLRDAGWASIHRWANHKSR